MKNFIVASVLGKTRPNQGSSVDQQQTGGEHGSNKQNRVVGAKGQQQQQQPVKTAGRRTDVQVTAKERPRGKSCDRMMQNRQSENRHYGGGEWNDDGGFGQWRAIHHQASSTTRPETYYHHARPVSVSITDRIQLVLQQDRQQKQQQQQQQIDNVLQLAANQRFQHHQAAFNGIHSNNHQYYPEYHPYPSMSSSNGTMATTSSWAYQSGSSSEEAVGPQSLDSQWAVQRQQQNNNNHHHQQGVNHPSYPASSMAQPPASSALSRKLSTYGTLPRNRQRFFMAKYQSK